MGQARQDLTGVKLDGARFFGLDLSLCTFNGASMRKVEIAECTLDQASLAKVDLTGASIRKTSMKGADLSEAILHQATLEGCDLGEDSKLAGASLVETRLPGVRIVNDELSRVKVMTDVDLSGTDLSGTRMPARKVTGTFDAYTPFPPGYKPASGLKGPRGDDAGGLLRLLSLLASWAREAALRELGRR